MELDLTPEQEARLIEIAKHEGMTVGELLMASVTRKRRVDAPARETLDDARDSIAANPS
jgi:hypothetical protein